MDSESIVFGDFKQCISNDITDYNELYIGIDWSSGVVADDTVVTALNEHNEQVFLLAFNNKQAFEQIDYIVQYLLPYGKKIKGILAETNGVGKPLVDNLKIQMGYGFGNKIMEWTTSNKSKIEIINALQVAFEQRKINILDDERQTAELSMYEAKVNSKGTVTYNAPTGGNDDMVIALMLALKCKDLKKNKGKYVISLI